ncbi:MAG: DUF4276 family protein [Magnetococcales bacterium]|nr:DUF4276 family protein [Magnetococcales bacterium]
MVRVVVLAEGQTEEQFIKRVVAPTLYPLGVYLEPRLMNTSQTAKGGAIHFDRLKFNAKNTLKMSSSPVLSTFLDLAALDTDFPAYADALRKATLYERVSCLEEALHEVITHETGCQPERFIPHIQPFEFEGLLFSDVHALCETEYEWHASQKKLDEIRHSFDNPEHINGNYATKPSKRLEETLIPKYRKTRHGPLAAERITISVMEAECAHFRAWINNLKNLSL